VSSGSPLTAGRSIHLSERPMVNRRNLSDYPVDQAQCIILTDMQRSTMKQLRFPVVAILIIAAYAVPGQQPRE
ncbi:MAG TPA: hypothetical protein VNB49_03005, partial [Candidatus Dormibacteraeota bacterium]|nr:hypothetical protein [Candidatus Dormibacteraeota bacterium]